MPAAPLRSAVIAAAGTATRMWPASKAVPKELFPLGRLPALAHLMIEFADAGVERIVVVVGSLGGSILALLDPRVEPPEKLRSDPDVQRFQQIVHDLEIVVVRQLGPYGNGVPLVNAIPLLRGEPFYYAFSDDIILGNVSRRLREVFEATGQPCVVMDEVPEEKVRQFGIAECAAPESPLPEGALRLLRILEKPGPGVTTSRYAVPGRYVVTPALAHEVATTPQGKGGEVWFTDALVTWLAAGRPVHAIATAARGDWYTVGDPDSYVAAVARFRDVHYTPR